MDGGRAGDWEERGGGNGMEDLVGLLCPGGSRAACRPGWVGRCLFFFWHANTTCALRLRTAVDGCGGSQRQVRFV
jgi:hypothetical protein